MPLDPSRVFMFPDSFNNLRKELIDNWPALWVKVQWAMAFDAELFVEMMNKELYTKLPQGADCDQWCSKYLKLLRAKRGAA